MKKILLIEDHPVVAEGISKIVKQIDFVDEFSFASSGKIALKMISDNKPDLILLDINLPDISGTELCKEIKKKNPEIKIIALSSYNQKSYIEVMLKNGASGYILKNATADEIIWGIREVSDGKLHLCHEASEIMNDKNTVKNILLSPREKEVLCLIAEGFTNPEIAEKLFISPLTVDSHRKNLLLKLSARNTASLIKTAFERGYL